MDLRTSLTSTVVWITLAAPLSASGPPADARPDLGRVLAGGPLREDLEQFRALLKSEWILAEAGPADYDAAIDALAADADRGLSLAELTFRLQRVIALGSDGHAGAGQFLAALITIPGPRPQFVVDLAGEDYVALTVQHDPLASVSPAIDHRFRPLKDGYPYLTAIDGRPMADWVGAATPYVPKGPERSVRWRAMRLLLELPFLRRELGLPDDPGIRVRLLSADRKEEIEIDAPVGPYKRWHLQVPRPDWRAIDGRLGYIWMQDTFGNGTATLVEGLANLRETKGLILDLRGNTGGNLEPLFLLACHLLRPEEPRRAAGRVVQWRGIGWKDAPGMAGWLAPESPDLSAEGRAVMAASRVPEGAWSPPAHRDAESRPVFFCRRDAEPGLSVFGLERFPPTYDYAGPVVALYDHRTFSGGELFLAALQDLTGAKLVGTETTAAAGGSTEFHRLKNSGLEILLSSRAFVRADGSLIDGRGIRPDVLVEPDPDYYLGTRDRMLEKAIEVLEGEIPARNK